MTMTVAKDAARSVGKGAHASPFVVAALAMGMFCAAACDDKSKAPQIAPAASALASSTAPVGASVIKFNIDPKGTTSIDMPAPKEHIKATTTAAAGSLSIDPTNLPNSHGEVKIDLTTITTTTFGDEAKDKTQTTHARTWLEVGDGEDGKLPDDVKKTYQYAVYAIRAIDQVSATDLAKVPPVREGGDDVRKVTMTTRGELLVHGHKVDREAEIEAAFHYAPGAAPTQPKEVLVTSKKPLHIVLGEHDVKPRDGFGKIAKGAFNLLGTKVADIADVSWSLRATP